MRPLSEPKNHPSSNGVTHIIVCSALNYIKDFTNRVKDIYNKSRWDNPIEVNGK